MISEKTMFPAEPQSRRLIVDIGRRLYDRGFVAANDGNISLKVSETTILATPTGVSKGFMSEEELVLVNLETGEWRGPIKPSTELKMHEAIYRIRPDVGSVVHTHPPYATAFAVAGIPLDKSILAEVIVSLGTIPIAEYRTPSTEEFAHQVARYAEQHDAILLSNHGAVTVGRDLLQAHYRMETLEHYAKISWLVGQLGQERTLTFDQVRELMSMRSFYGFTPPSPECVDCPVTRTSQDVIPRTSFSEESPPQLPNQEQVTNIVMEVLKRLRQ